MIDSLPPTATTSPTDILFSDDVAIAFHPGAAPDVWWATMHVGSTPIEIGSVHGAHDLDDVLRMAAGVLVERSRWADLVYVGTSGQRWVLIGCWVLNARMMGGHRHFMTPEKARAEFSVIAREGRA